MSPAPQAPLERTDAERARVLKRKVHDRLTDVGRHLDALREAMASFGDNFDREVFRKAFRSHDPEELNRVKAVERGVDQLYNYLAELARFGLELAGVRNQSDETNAARDFKDLRESRVVSAQLTRTLQTLRELRRLMVHEYVSATAEQVHAAAWIINDEFPRFHEAYTRWIKLGFARSTGPRRPG